jgi:hypothetical protein
MFKKMGAKERRYEGGEVEIAHYLLSLDLNVLVFVPRCITNHYFFFSNLFPRFLIFLHIFLFFLFFFPFNYLCSCVS